MSIVLMVALLGWLATGVGWYVSQRSLRRNALSKAFANQVRNSARVEIASAVRNRQNVLSRIVAAGASLSMTYQHDVAAATWSDDKWREVFDDLQQICGADDAQWALVLEQYEALFPGTGECRRQLVERAAVLAGDLVSFSECLLRPATRNSALSTVDGLMARLMARLIDEQALLEDLLVISSTSRSGQSWARRLRAVSLKIPQSPEL